MQMPGLSPGWMQTGCQRLGPEYCLNPWVPGPGDCCVCQSLEGPGEYVLSPARGGSNSFHDYFICTATGRKPKCLNVLSIPDLQLLEGLPAGRLPACSLGLPTSPAALSPLLHGYSVSIMGFGVPPHPLESCPSPGRCS